MFIQAAYLAFASLELLQLRKFLRWGWELKADLRLYRLFEVKKFKKLGGKKMKKLMVFLLIGCLALLIGSSVFAGNSTPAPTNYPATSSIHEEGNIGASEWKKGWTNSVYDSIDLKATVLPYARVKFISPQVSPDKTSIVLSGRENQTVEGQVEYTLEANCDAYSDGVGTAFKGVTWTNDVLDTAYNCLDSTDSLDRGWVPAGQINWDAQDFTPFKYDTILHKHIGYRATNGHMISHQHAQEYKATYTVFVYSSLVN